MRGRNRSALKDRYAVLLDIGRTLAATLQPRELYRALWEQTRRVLEAEAFFVARFDAETETAAVVFHAHGGEEIESDLRYPAAESPVIRERRAMLQRHDDGVRWPPGRDAGVGPASSMAAPILRGEDVLGVIGAQSRTEGAYDRDDLELFTAIADLAAVALENALYVEQLERRRQEAERIEEIGRAITGSLELSKVLDRAARAAADLLQADGSTIWLVHDDATVEVAMTAGRTLFPQGLVFQADAQMIAGIRNHPKRTFTNLDDFPLAPPSYRALAQSTGSSVGVLLTADESFFGALSVRHHLPRRYSDEELRLLRRIADQAAIAVTNARMHERMLALSLTDPLTQLPNRRHLQMCLAKEFAAARRGRRLALVLYDLDNFKAYNDSAGHQAGDEALKAFAEILAQNTRAMNLTARYGGDEFLTVLTDVGRKGTLAHVQRVTDLVEAHPLLGPAGIRASCGIALYSDRVRSAEALVNAADRNLYRRKAQRAGS